MSLSSTYDALSEKTFIILFGKIISGNTFEILIPLLLTTLLAPNKTELKPIPNVKNINTKPISSPESHACWDANGSTSLLEKVSIEKFGDSRIPVKAKEKVNTIELVHLPVYKKFLSKISVDVIVPGIAKYAE